MHSSTSLCQADQLPQGPLATGGRTQHLAHVFVLCSRQLLCAERINCPRDHLPPRAEHSTWHKTTNSKAARSIQTKPACEHCLVSMCLCRQGCNSCWQIRFGLEDSPGCTIAASEEGDREAVRKRRKPSECLARVQNKQQCCSVTSVAVDLMYYMQNEFLFSVAM